MDEERREDKGRNGRNWTLSDVPLSALTRLPVKQIFAIGTAIVAITGFYYKVQTHGEQIAALQITSQTKEEAQSEQRLILERLKDLKEHMERIENQLQERPQPQRHKTER